MGMKVLGQRIHLKRCGRIVFNFENWCGF